MNNIFSFWKLKLILVFLISVPMGISLFTHETYSGYSFLFYIGFPVSIWVFLTFILNEFKGEIKGTKERLFIFGLYSKSIKGYLCYYLDENDAIKQLEKRSDGLIIDYSRGVATNNQGDVVFSIHPIVVIK